MNVWSLDKARSPVLTFSCSNCLSNSATCEDTRHTSHSNPAYMRLFCIAKGEAYCSDGIQDMKRSQIPKQLHRSISLLKARHLKEYSTKE